MMLFLLGKYLKIFKLKFYIYIPLPAETTENKTIVLIISKPLKFISVFDTFHGTANELIYKNTTF